MTSAVNLSAAPTNFFCTVLSQNRTRKLVPLMLKAHTVTMARPMKAKTNGTALEAMNCLVAWNVAFALMPHQS